MGLISITSLLLHEILFIFPVHSMISYNFAEDIISAPEKHCFDL